MHGIPCVVVAYVCCLEIGVSLVVHERFGRIHTSISLKRTVTDSWPEVPIDIWLGIHCIPVLLLLPGVEYMRLTCTCTPVWFCVGWLHVAHVIRTEGCAPHVSGACVAHAHLVYIVCIDVCPSISVSWCSAIFTGIIQRYLVVLLLQTLKGAE